MNKVSTPDEKVIYIEDKECIILSDIHLGVTYPNKPYPVMEHQNIHKRILQIIEKFEPKEIVFNGDIFSTTSIDEYWVDMFGEFSQRVDRLVFIKGNHEKRRDGYPEFIQNTYSVKQQYNLDDYLIHHGHRTPTTPSSINIIGHLHPQIDDKDVLLYGDSAYHNTDVFVLPKFSNVVGGSTVGGSSVNCPVVNDGKPLEEYDIVRSYDTTRLL